MSLFEDFGKIYDDSLGLDEGFKGEPPRYRHQSTLNRLCNQNNLDGENNHDLDGSKLMENLYDELRHKWLKTSNVGAGFPSQKNWRFDKHTEFDPDGNRPETSLERTIALVTDDNWANQVPTVSGLVGAGANHLDLIHRNGSEYSLIELKVDANTPLYAAFQVIRYGVAYAFSRTHAPLLGYKVREKELLRASAIHLRVLAPAGFYPDECGWLCSLEQSLNSGVESFAKDLVGLEIPMSFGFEIFPRSWEWQPDQPHCAADQDAADQDAADQDAADQDAADQDAADQRETTQRELLWALHQRHSPFTE